jgi:sugar lactone lactonase YvrE
MTIEDGEAHHERQRAAATVSMHFSTGELNERFSPADASMRLPNGGTMSSRPQMTKGVELALDARAELGEGPVWSERERRLIWVDIPGRAVHLSDLANGKDRRIALDGMPGAVVERAGGGLALAWAKGFGALVPANGRVESWCHPEAHLPLNRFNDGKCDAQGSFWAGTMATDEPRGPNAALYRLGPDRRAVKMLDRVTISNGLAWSADGSTLFYIDTPTSCIAAYEVRGDRLGPKRVAVEVDSQEHGWLDGMCIDAEGLLWVAHFGGGRVNRFDPRNGRLVQTVRLPVSNATSCCFGGERLDHLYITTARLGLDERGRTEQPTAGSVYRYQTGAIGLPSTPFAG